MYSEKNINIKYLINITEDFIDFLAQLYREEIITYEQFENMKRTKKQFLDKQNCILKNE